MTSLKKIIIDNCSVNNNFNKHTNDTNNSTAINPFSNSLFYLLGFTAQISIIIKSFNTLFMINVILIYTFFILL